MSLKTAIAGIALTTLTATLSAQGTRITRIEFTPAPVEQGGGVIIGILGSGPCTYAIDFGDGETAHRTADLPDHFRHAYPADAEYTVVATPESPCEGVARARIDVRAIARGIWRIQVEPGPATDAAEVLITLDGRGTCTVNLDFGDRKTQKIDGALPAKINHKYASGGTYNIHAWADEPCRGDTTVRVDVRR